MSGILFAGFYDVIVVQKSSSQAGKYTSYGWGYHIKSDGKSLISLSFLFSTGNDIRRKLLYGRIHSTVGTRAKRMPDTTVKTTAVKNLANIFQFKLFIWSFQV